MGQSVYLSLRTERLGEVRYQPLLKHGLSGSFDIFFCKTEEHPEFLKHFATLVFLQWKWGEGTQWMCCSFFPTSCQRWKERCDHSFPGCRHVRQKSHGLANSRKICMRFLSAQTFLLCRGGNVGWPWECRSSNSPLAAFILTQAAWSVREAWMIPLPYCLEPVTGMWQLQKCVCGRERHL